MPFHDRAAILLLTGALAVLNVACSRISSWSSSNDNESKRPVTALPSPSAAANLPENFEPVATPSKQAIVAAQEAYERALDAAYSAALLSQSAVSAEDWQLVIGRWQEAISLLRKVPYSSPFYAMAKPKIPEYQRNLGIAQQLATQPRRSSPSGIAIATAPQPGVEPNSPSSSQTGKTPTSSTQLKTNSANQQVFQVPIKRRAGRTPVVDVTFNGNQVFEMIIDTGASGTVITEEMAQSLGVVPEGEVLADTASGRGVKFSTTTVESIAVNGAEARNVRVAIAGSDLELGLLGQDFFGNYDVSLKQNVIEFHRR